MNELTRSPNAADLLGAPGVGESQKDFTIGIYLLHEGNRPPYPEKLEQAQGIEKSLIAYFHAATGGRMRLTAAPPRKRSETQNARWSGWLGRR